MPASESGSVIIPGDCRPADIENAWLNAAAITIVFENFSDGRGLSLASYLRQTLGYTGTLHASGNLLPDQWQELLGAGFNDVQHTGDSRDADRQNAANPFVCRTYLHASADSGVLSIWQQRHQRNDL